MAKITYDAALLTDVGMKRKQNQDRGLIRPDLGLYIVADGMGGHQGGETASRICAETVEETIQGVYTEKKNIPDQILLQQALQMANQKILEVAKNEPTLKGMGTTAIILKISDDIATIAQVGDSRAYYWSTLGIWQLTRDHSLVQEKLRAGLITRQQVRTDSMKNVITRSVGYDLNMKVDTYTFKVEPGDGFLLCSDGLSGPLEDQEIFAILNSALETNLTLEDAAKNLIDAANARGGDDNITAALIRGMESIPDTEN